MNLKEIEKSLQNNNKFIFLGEELYLAHYCLKKLKKTLNQEFLIFNYIEINQEIEAFEEALMKIEAIPMMDAKKIVHITRFNFAIDSNPWNKSQIKLFEESIRNLPEDTKLIISNDEVKKAGNLGLFKSLGKIMQVIPLDRLNGPDLRSFIRDYLEKGIGKEKTTRLLVEELIKLSAYLDKGATTSLFEIEEMLVKVVGMAGEKEEIGSKELYELFEQKREADIFRLLNTIRDRDKKKAFFEYRLLRESGEPGIKIMITMAKMLSTMVKSSYYLSDGYSAAETAKELGKKPYAIEAGMVFLKRFGRRNLIEMIDRIIEVDYKFKTGMIDESVYGELALARIFEVIEN